MVKVLKSAYAKSYQVVLNGMIGVILVIALMGYKLEVESVSDTMARFLAIMK